MTPAPAAVPAEPAPRSSVVCGYCRRTIGEAEYVRHDLQTHDGLRRMRDSHQFVCIEYGQGRCVCSIDAYEQAAREAVADRITSGKGAESWRFGVHYDAIPHNPCMDAARCDCECDGCMDAYVGWLQGTLAPVAAAPEPMAPAVVEDIFGDARRHERRLMEGDQP